MTENTARREDRELVTPRQREILKTLIQEYIESALPIGSSTLQRIARLDVSSATIRNELAELEELGYLAQPHTSAGRVPTVKGYRFFVEEIMEQAELPVAEQRTIRHQFYQVRLDLEQWMKLTAAVLAHAAQAASLITSPRAPSSRYKHMELISINDAMCLMVLVLEDSSIHQEMLITREPINQEALSQIANKLNRLLHGRTPLQIESQLEAEETPLSEWENQVSKRIMHLMKQVDECSVTEIYRDGLMNLLKQPEFVEVQRSRQIVELLEQRSALEAILSNIMNTNGVQIIIGGEEPYEHIDDVSLILSQYGVRGQAAGVLGVMGPVRMPYARAISAVRYVAGIMNSLLSDLYGSWWS